MQWRVFFRTIPLSTTLWNGWGRPKASNPSRSTIPLWEALKNVQLDAKQRKLIWPDTKRLDLGQSVRRIKKEYPNLPNGKIEDYLLYWIEGDYTPEGYSEAQLRELDRLTGRWIADHFA